MSFYDSPILSSTPHYQSDSLFQTDSSASFSYSLSNQSQLSKKQKLPLKSGKENQGRWSKEEHEIFLKGLEKYGKDWKKIASCIESRTIVQVRTHAQKYLQKLDISKKEELLGNKIIKDDSTTSSDSPIGIDLPSISLSDSSPQGQISNDFSYEIKDLYPINSQAHSQNSSTTSPSGSHGMNLYTTTNSTSINMPKLSIVNPGETITNEKSFYSHTINFSEVNTDRIRNSSPTLLLSDPLTTNVPHTLTGSSSSTVSSSYNNNNNNNSIPSKPYQSSHNLSSYLPVINTNHGLSSSFSFNPLSNSMNPLRINDNLIHPSFNEYMNMNSDDEYERREEAPTFETLSSLISTSDAHDFIPHEDYMYKRRKSSIFEDDEVPECFQIPDV